MIYKEDLEDFHIEYERVIKKYRDVYIDEENIFINIEDILEKLFNFYFMNGIGIMDLCFRLNDELINLSLVLYKDDFKNLFDDIFKLLLSFIEELEYEEKYEICYNIVEFVDIYKDVIKYNNIMINRGKK